MRLAIGSSDPDITSLLPDRRMSRRRFPSTPLMRLSPVRSVVCLQGRGYWVDHGSQGSACFHASQRDWLADRPLGRERPSFILPSGELLFRVPSALPLLPPFRGNHTSLGFGPRSMSLMLVYLRGASQASLAPTSGDLSLSSVFSMHQLVGLFHPTTESRTIDRSRDYTPHTAPSSRRRSAAPLPLALAC
jgi:hypothetical protein